MLFLLVKGVNGFGNMISTLSYAFDLAQKSNRILVIDWTHPEWRLGFDRYFYFNDSVKYMDYQSFLEHIKQRKVKVYPQQFSGKLDKSLIELFPTIDSEPNAYQKLFGSIQLQVNFKNVDVCIFSYNYCGYDGIGRLFENMYINNELKDKIDVKIEFLNEYKSIHIRHQDIKNESLIWVQEFLKQNQNSNIYMATDNPRLLDIYKKWHPNIFNFTKFFDPTKPLHSQELLDEEKNQVNENTIIDLMILARSKQLQITPKKTIPWMSTYSLLALTLHNLYMSAP
jgi:hypothetical protein